MPLEMNVGALMNPVAVVAEAEELSPVGDKCRVPPSAADGRHLDATSRHKHRNYRVAVSVQRAGVADPEGYDLSIARFDPSTHGSSNCRE